MPKWQRVLSSFREVLMSEPTFTGAHPPTPDEALANAARLLQAAEFETDLNRMERYEKLADSWVSIAGLQHERARV